MRSKGGCGPDWPLGFALQQWSSSTLLRPLPASPRHLAEEPAFSGHLEMASGVLGPQPLEVRSIASSDLQISLEITRP